MRDSHGDGDPPHEGRPMGDEPIDGDPGGRELGDGELGDRELGDAALAQLLRGFARDVRRGARLVEIPERLSERLTEIERESTPHAGGASLARHAPRIELASAGSDAAEDEAQGPSPLPAATTWAAAALLLILAAGLFSRLWSGSLDRAPAIEWMGLSAQPGWTRTGETANFAVGERLYVHLTSAGEGAAFLWLLQPAGVELLPPTAANGRSPAGLAAPLDAGDSVPWQFEATGSAGPRVLLLTTVSRMPSDERLEALLERVRAAWQRAGAEGDFGRGVDAVLEVLRAEARYRTEVQLFELRAS